MKKSRAEVMNTQLPIPEGVTFFDYSVSSINKAVEKIQLLIS